MVDVQTIYVDPPPYPSDVERLYRAHLETLQSILIAVEQGTSIRRAVALHLVELVDQFCTSEWFENFDPTIPPGDRGFGFLHAVIEDLFASEVPEDSDDETLIGAGDGKLTLREFTVEKLLQHTHPGFDAGHAAA